ncbi:MAG: hypothetical protein AAF799_08680 [Myxococcota bacterium]
MLALALAACQPLPEVEYETERLSLATDFDEPVCAGTLAALDSAAAHIDDTFARDDNDDRYVVYWLEDELSDFCDDDASGCYYPGTRVVFAHAESIAHELVHATIDSPGDAFFMEEGIAELYGGTGVRHRASNIEGRLASQLMLSRRDYEHGRLSYPQAAHFTHWLRETEGISAVQRLASHLSEGADDAEIGTQLELIFGELLPTIEDRYREEAPRLYRGIYDDQIETAQLGDTTLWAKMRLNCSSEHVLGPLPGPTEGMARLLRLEVPQRRDARLVVHGDPGTWVEIVDPYVADREFSTPWWPTRDHEGRLVRAEPGMSASVTLDAGTYLVVFASMGTTPRLVELQILRGR